VNLGPLDIYNHNLRFPDDKEAKRCYSLHECFCRLPNNEKIMQNCFIYSPKQGALFCFCFNLFNSNSDSLTSCGFRDWQGLSKVLKTREVCRNHVTNICSRKELANRIRNSCLIDEASQDTAEGKMNSWRLVLERLFKIIMFLVKDILLHGVTEKFWRSQRMEIIGVEFQL
jgi:hypothetical protein